MAGGATPGAVPGGGGGVVTRLGFVWLAAYLGSIVLANWLVSHVGLVPVGFGLLAPAGVYVVGLGFLLENLVTEALGRRWTLAGIAGGVALSWLVSPHFAFASGATFLLSETCDFMVFVRLRRRSGLIRAALAGDLASDVLDSVVFLLLAFGSLAFLPGQLIGKWSMTGVAVGVLWLVRRAVRARIVEAA